TTMGNNAARTHTLRGGIIPQKESQGPRPVGARYTMGQSAPMRRGRARPEPRAVYNGKQYRLDLPPFAPRATSFLRPSGAAAAEARARGQRTRAMLPPRSHRCSARVRLFEHRP